MGVITKSLDEIAVEPALASELTPGEAGEACGRALVVIAATAARMLQQPNSIAAAPARVNRHEPERIMKAKEAAEMTGLSRDYLYRHPELPFRVQITDKRVGFSYRETLAWINQRGRRG